MHKVAGRRSGCRSVEGGLPIFAIVRVAYSAKKIKDYRKKKNEELF